MFFVWAAKGAEIGVTAFFTIAVFAMLCGGFVGLAWLMRAGMKWADDGRGRDGYGHREKL